MSKTPERPLCERCRKKPQRPGCGDLCLDCAIDDVREKNLVEGRPDAKCGVCGKDLSPRAKMDKCTDCQRKEANDRWRNKGAEGGGEVVPHAPPSEKGEEEKETEMSETPKCTGCHQPPKEGERLYGGKCPDCRSAGKAARKRPLPLRERARVRGKRRNPGSAWGGKSMKKPDTPIAPDTAEILTKVKGQLNYHIEEARKHRAALIVLKDMTGADIEIPEIGA